MEQITENLFKELMVAMDESMNDSGQIASSAISMAVNRSRDLKMHPIMTLIMVKGLAEVNIELMFEQTVKNMAFIPREFHEKQLKNLEELIGEICRDKTHKVTIG